MNNIIVKNHNTYLIIEQKVEIDTVAAGSHKETKREIDYTQIVALWMTTMISSPSHTPI